MISISRVALQLKSKTTFRKSWCLDGNSWIVEISICFYGYDVRRSRSNPTMKADAIEVVYDVRRTPCSDWLVFISITRESGACVIVFRFRSGGKELCLRSAMDWVDQRVPPRTYWSTYPSLRNCDSLSSKLLLTIDSVSWWLRQIVAMIVEWIFPL